MSSAYFACMPHEHFCNMVYACLDMCFVLVYVCGICVYTCLLCVYSILYWFM